MKAPIINLNGDSKSTLERESLEAIEAIDKAIKALSSLTIHGRNYPTGWEGGRETIEEVRGYVATLTAIGEILVDYHLDIARQ